MPVITARVKLEWISGGWQPYTSHPVETDRSRLMDELVVQLRSLVTQVVSKVDDVHFRPRDTVLEVEPVHGWSENVPDLKIEIRLNEIDGTEDERQKRRWAIARDVSGKIFSYLDQDRFLALIKPAVAVECLPARSSGISRRHDGTLINNWGVPDYSSF